MLIQKINIFCSVVLHISVERMEYIVSNIDKYYGEYFKYKLDKNGNKRLNKPKYQKRFGEYWGRTINPPHKELKILQKRINSYIIGNIPMPEFAFGGVKGKDNILNAKQHKGQKYVFQTDMKDFYPYITNKMVYKMFVDKGFSPDVARVLTKLTTYKGHLPQGAPTSTTIANYVFEPTGRKIEQKLNGQMRFSTFVDDITISSQSDFKNTTPDIIDILLNDGYKISHNKTTYKSGIKEITGVRVYNNGMTTTEKFNKKYSSKDNLPKGTVRGMDNYKQRVKIISSQGNSKL